MKLKVLALCDGISMGKEALDRLGIEHEYHAIEISPKKRKISNLNHSGIIRPFNDVFEILDHYKKHGTPHYDLILAGPTCTSLSSQGNRKEWDGESAIFFTCAEIVEKIKSVNPKVKFLFENVASMRNVVRDDISKALGVDHWLGESRFVTAQDRKRYYWFNWEAPVLSDLGITANSILDDDGLHMISFSKSNRNKVGEPPIVEGRIKPMPKSNTLTTGVGCNGQSTMNKVITKGMQVRNLSVSECARLQGAGNYSFDFCTQMDAYEALGDGWNIPTVEAILKKLA